jgi:carbamoyltransferase
MNKEAILGVGALGHDAASALVSVETGEIHYAIAEERLRNLKHSWHFPYGCIQAARDYAVRHGIQIVETAINYRPEDFSTGTLRKEVAAILQDAKMTEELIAVLKELIVFADYFQPSSFSDEQVRSWLTAHGVSAELHERLCLRISWYYNWSVKYRRIGEIVGGLLPGIPVRHVNHHLCHAASTHYSSGFDRSCVITWDGQGESQTTCVYAAGPNGIRLVAETMWPFSLGMLYFGATNYLGFKLGDEFKVMGMAAYGKPRFYDALRELVVVEKGPTIRFENSDLYARQEFPTGHYWYYFTDKMKSLVSRRLKNLPIAQEHFDLAASIQKVFEDVGVEFARHALAATGVSDLCLSGGVALNGLMNEAIRRQSGCAQLHVFPAAGDDGTAVGAAWQRIFERGGLKSRKLGMPFFGGSSDNDEIRLELERMKLVFEEPPDIHERIAEALAAHEIVARFQGRSEFGPRALGNRSILANPARAEMKDILNERIKHREMFRPFAPACLLERVSEYFDIDVEAPFMLLIAPARPIAHERIPAAVHADGTSRVQTISREENPEFYKTIAAVERLTGTPVIINTSFNINGEAIVETPRDAVESFAQMDIDHLAIGKFWVSKASNQFPKMTDAEFLEIRKKRFTEAHQHVLAQYDINRDYFTRPGRKPDHRGGLLAGLFRTFSSLKPRS